MITLEYWNSLTDDTRKEICHMLRLGLTELWKEYHSSLDDFPHGSALKKVLMSCTEEEDGKLLVEKVITPVFKGVKENGLHPYVKQFYDLKKRHPDAILLFRTKDFYVCYGKDASEISEILVVTHGRLNGILDKDGLEIDFASFSHHALDSYLPKLIRAGKRVAICDQIAVR